MHDTDNKFNMSCTVKWFNLEKGFGFLKSNEIESDIFLHQSVLQKFGQNRISEDETIEVIVSEASGKFKVLEIINIERQHSTNAQRLSQLKSISSSDLASLRYAPCRVKWFDESKGIGFANEFGMKGDIFIHNSILLFSGFTTLLSGEAVLLKVISGDRGLLAVDAAPWSKSFGLEAKPDCGEKNSNDVFVKF